MVSALFHLNLDFLLHDIAYVAFELNDSLSNIFSIMLLNIVTIDGLIDWKEMQVLVRSMPGE